MTENRNAKELLGRYLRNRCSNPEHVLVEDWYNDIQLQGEEDIAGWAEASRKTFLQQHAALRKNRFTMGSRRWTAAAATLVLVGGGLLYLSGRLKGRNQKKPVAPSRSATLSGAGI